MIHLVRIVILKINILRNIDKRCLRSRIIFLKHFEPLYRFISLLLCIIELILNEVILFNLLLLLLQLILEVLMHSIEILLLLKLHN